MMPMPSLFPTLSKAVNETPEYQELRRIFSDHGWTAVDRKPAPRKSGDPAHLIFLKDGSKYEFDVHAFDEHQLWCPIVMYRRDERRRVRIAQIYEASAMNDILSLSEP